ncbi:MAG: hypothetical protein GY842_16940 [bacterium]|nr:hypothetical protein [bacterium]
MPVLRGFGLSVLVETPILLIALSPRHGWRWRLFAGFWLTACTYPVVALVLPYLLSPSDSRGAYLLAAETFAPLAECCLFWLAFDRGQPCRRSELLRNFGAIVGANLVSFGLGALLWG